MTVSNAGTSDGQSSAGTSDGRNSVRMSNAMIAESTARSAMTDGKAIRSVAHTKVRRMTVTIIAAAMNDAKTSRVTVGATTTMTFIITNDDALLHLHLAVQRTTTMMKRRTVTEYGLSHLS